MGIAPERALVTSARSLHKSSRALHALPHVHRPRPHDHAYGRNHMLVFGSGTVTESAALIALPLVLCWVGVIALRGGYDQGVFGAGADEYKAVVSSSLLTAAALGIGCYLVQFQLSRGFFLFAFLWVSLLSFLLSLLITYATPQQTSRNFWRPLRAGSSR